MRRRVRSASAARCKKCIILAIVTMVPPARHGVSAHREGSVKRVSMSATISVQSNQEILLSIVVGDAQISSSYVQLEGDKNGEGQISNLALGTGKAVRARPRVSVSAFARSCSRAAKLRRRERRGTRSRPSRPRSCGRRRRWSERTRSTSSSVSRPFSSRPSTGNGPTGCLRLPGRLARRSKTGTLTVVK